MHSHTIALYSVQTHTLIQQNCHYALRKFNFTNRVIPIWNIFSNHGVSANTTNTSEARLHKFWCNKDVVYDYKADLHGTGNGSIIMQLFRVLYTRILVLFLGYRGPWGLLPAHLCNVMWCDVARKAQSEGYMSVYLRSNSSSNVSPLHLLVHYYN